MTKSILSSMRLYGLCILLAGVVIAAGYANPGACSGVCVNTHDPSVIRRSSDGAYFRFSTGGRIAVHTAPALSGPWTYKGAALPRGSSINLPGNQDLWAPEVIKSGNTYYLYYSVSQFGSQNSAIGVASSSTLDVGTWTDLGATGVRSTPGKPYNAIDPALILVNGNAWLMTFGSFWGGLHQVDMRSDPPTVVTTSARQVAHDPVTTAVEGAYMFKRGSWYYLFYSKGKCCGYDKQRPPAGQEYKILVCRSSSATGGFVDRNGKNCLSGGGTVVLESHGYVYGPGGQGVFEDPAMGPVLYYHYVDTRVGYADGQKRFGWNRIDFSSGWPVV